MILRVLENFLVYFFLVLYFTIPRHPFNLIALNL